MWNFKELRADERIDDDCVWIDERGEVKHVSAFSDEYMQRPMDLFKQFWRVLDASEGRRVCTGETEDRRSTGIF